jgi:hypothetical protein
MSEEFKNAMKEKPIPAPVQAQRKSWYNDAEGFDKWRVFPRLLISLYGVMFYKTSMWFMTLPDPTNAQSAFVSVIVGAGAAWFGLYVGNKK